TKHVEAIIGDELCQTVHAISGYFFKEPLQSLHEIYERHSVQTLEVPIYHRLVAFTLGDHALDVAERSPDICNFASVMENRSPCFVGKWLPMTQNVFDLPRKRFRRERHGYSRFSFATSFPWLSSACICSVVSLSSARSHSLAVHFQQR